MREYENTEFIKELDKEYKRVYMQQQRKDKERKENIEKEKIWENRKVYIFLHTWLIINAYIIYSRGYLELLF